MEAVIHLVDASFKKDKLSNYHLSIQIHNHTLSVCITDIKQSTAVAVWSLNSKYPLVFTEKSDDFLTGALNKCPLPLNGSYGKTNVSIASSVFTFVPQPLFDKTQLRNYIELNCGTVEHGELMHDTIEHENMILGYIVPDQVKEVLDKSLGEFNLIHHSNVFLNSITGDFNSNDTELYVNYKHNQLELLYFNNAKFHHGNIYKIGAPEDVLYYILNSCEQLKLNPQNIKLVLLGAIKTGDKIHQLSFSYFDKIQFGAIQSKFKIAPALNDLSKHYFYTLYKQYLCE
ncbi:MAG: hypothetical protein ACJAZ2_000851 [Glaciecola sp.]|jgi:hypothetical protein